MSLDPAKMPRIGTVDERFASYNIEMAEVTGGNFWKPYHSQSSAAAASDTACAICFDPGRHEPEHVPVSSAYRSLRIPNCVSSPRRLGLPTCE